MQLYRGNLPPHVRKPGGRGVQLYTGSRLPYILPSSDTRKPGGRGVQLKPQKCYEIILCNKPLANKQTLRQLIRKCMASIKLTFHLNTILNIKSQKL